MRFARGWATIVGVSLPSRLGPYRILGLLGRGGMAEVLHAQAFGASGFVEDVALKVLLPELRGNVSLEKLLLDEARLGAQLHHPCLVAVHDLGVDEGVYYVRMELVDGADLSTLTLGETEQVLAGRLPSGHHDLREIYEARNLGAVTTDLVANTETLSTDLILRWHRMLLAGIRDDAAGRFRRAGEWARVGSHLGANPEFVSGLISDALVRYRDDITSSPLDAIARFQHDLAADAPLREAAQREVRVADAVAGVGVRVRAGHVREQHRRVLPVVAAADRGGAELGARRGGALVEARGADLGDRQHDDAAKRVSAGFGGVGRGDGEQRQQCGGGECLHARISRRSRAPKARRESQTSREDPSPA